MDGLRSKAVVIDTVLAAGSWQSHRASHREHVQADLGNTPELMKIAAGSA
jgi:hypothetical protein